MVTGELHKPRDRKKTGMRTGAQFEGLVPILHSFQPSFFPKKPEHFSNWVGGFLARFGSMGLEWGRYPCAQRASLFSAFFPGVCLPWVSHVLAVLITGFPRARVENSLGLWCLFNRFGCGESVHSPRHKGVLKDYQREDGQGALIRSESKPH